MSCTDSTERPKRTHQKAFGNFDKDELLHSARNYTFINASASLPGTHQCPHHTLIVVIVRRLDALGDCLMVGLTWDARWCFQIFPIKMLNYHFTFFSRLHSGKRNKQGIIYFSQTCAQTEKILKNGGGNRKAMEKLDLRISPELSTMTTGPSPQNITSTSSPRVLLHWKLLMWIALCWVLAQRQYWGIILCNLQDDVWQLKVLHKYPLSVWIGKPESYGSLLLLFISMRVLRLREMNHLANEQQSLGFTWRPSNTKAYRNYWTRLLRDFTEQVDEMCFILTDSSLNDDEYSAVVSTMTCIKNPLGGRYKRELPGISNVRGEWTSTNLRSWTFLILDFGQLPLLFYTRYQCS